MNRSILISLFGSNRILHLQALADQYQMEVFDFIKMVLDAYLQRHNCADKYVGTDVYGKSNLQLDSEVGKW